jgi:hypothetical protein
MPVHGPINTCTPASYLESGTSMHQLASFVERMDLKW